jgi:hypothetical protein
MILILLFILINISTSNIINIYKPSVITFKYKNINPYPVSIYINDIKFRESSLLPHHQGIFSIGVNPGKYLISSNKTKYSIEIDEAKILKTYSKLNNILIMKNKWTILEKINYNHPIDHQLKISSMVNLVKYNYKYGAYIIDIYLDNKIINTNILNTNVFSYITDYINVKKGKHTILLKSISLNNIWCSCMTSGDGFNYGRHLSAWIKNNENKNETIIKNNDNKTIIIKNNIIKHKQKENINVYLNDNIFKINFVEKKIENFIGKIIF